MSRKWRAPDVHSMQSERVQFAHVARHLYKARERWDQVVPDLGDVLQRALAADCIRPVLNAKNPDCYRASDCCRAHVLRDHDEILAPAYHQQMASAEAAERVGHLRKGPRGWALVGDLGVYVVVRVVGPERHPEVKTAYRVEPPVGDGRSSEDYLKAAVRKLRDKSSWKGGGK